MEKWQRALRKGLLPLLSDKALEVLVKALETNDPDLIQGETIVSFGIPEFMTTEPVGACLIAYAGWKGEGLQEIGVDDKSGKTLISIDERYYRPSEVDLLLGDSTKAKQKLGWEPTKRFSDIVKDMVEAEK